MRKYMMFVYKDGSQKGGWNDFKGSADDFAALHKMVDMEHDKSEYIMQIVESEGGHVVFQDHMDKMVS